MSFLDDAEYRSESDERMSDSDIEADLAAAEIQTAQKASASSAVSFPSAGSVLATASVLQEAAELVTPTGALEEEALLLLVRRARSETSKGMQVGCVRSSQMPHHWVDDAAAPASSQQPQQNLESQSQMQSQPSANAELDVAAYDEDCLSESDSDDGGADGNVDLPQSLVDWLGKPCFQAPGQQGRWGNLLIRWARQCHAALSAMLAYANVKDVDVGKDKSISIVMLKSHSPIAGCNCVRCKWKDESQDVMWAHWIYNTDKLLACASVVRFGLSVGR